MQFLEGLKTENKKNTKSTHTIDRRIITGVYYKRMNMQCKRLGR